MKEVTMITTCEITSIHVVDDEDVNFMINNRDTVDSILSDCIRSETGADDVDILKNRFFVRDVQN